MAGRKGMHYYTKRKFKKPELIAQCQVIEWARAREEAGDLPGIDLLYSIQNGARVAVGTAVALKLSGGKKGVPDLHLAVARGKWHSLYIEMKAPNGHLSKEQKEIQPRLIEEGHRVENCWNSVDAIKILFNYLNTDPERKLTEI